MRAHPDLPRRTPSLGAAAAPRVSPWPVLVVVAALCALAIWLVSPRFAIDGPSLVDDWSAIARSPDQAGDVLRLSNPERERFRPSWIIWSYLEWHTFDAPQGLVGPNVWNVARIVVFVLGMTLLTWLLLPAARGRRGTLIHAGIAGIPAFAVLTVPKFARDLAWFGPQEPLLLGGLALGGALLGLAVRRVLSGASAAPTALAAAAGALFWPLGVYHKELSLAAVPLLAAVLWVQRAQLARWRRVTPRRQVALAVLGAVVALPLVHVAVEALAIALRGDVVYDADVSGAGIVDGIRVLYEWWHEAMPLPARQLLVGGAVLTAVAAVVRRSIPVLAVGSLGSATLALLMAAQSGVAVSRYYIPTYALCALAFSLALVRLPQVVQAAGLLLVFFAFVPVTAARDEVRRWSDEEQAHAKIVDLVAELDASGCRVAAEGLNLETSIALPSLVALEQPRSDRACAQDGAYLVLPPYPDERLELWRACAPGALAPLAVGPLLGVYECRRLDDAASAVDVLRRHSFDVVSG